MRRLQILILIFCMTVSVPLGYFVLQTYRGLEQEEASTLNFFANTLFDEIERFLETLVEQEESRAIDEYNFFMSPSGGDPDSAPEIRSPISHLSAHDYIVGYFQNNPDGFRSLKQTFMLNDVLDALNSRLQIANDLD